MIEKIEEIIDSCLKELKIYKDYKDKPLSYKYGLISGNYNIDFESECKNADTLKKKSKLLNRIVWGIPGGAKVFKPKI